MKQLLRPCCTVALLALLAFAVPAAFSSRRVQLSPRLRAGQVLFYRIDFKVTRDLQTQSRVSSPELPSFTHLDSAALLQVEVMNVSTSGIQLVTYFSPRETGGARPPDNSSAAVASVVARPVGVTVGSNGSAPAITGLDKLTPAQQFAWNGWLAAFTSSMTFPAGGVGLNQKWESIEPETSPSPIARLSWDKKYQYVRDEPCPIAAMTSSAAVQSGPAPQPCAVVFLHATMHQKSPQKNATPEDYKQRNLKTQGTASGQNDTIFYVSLATGLLVHSSEDAKQSMDVLVALTDDSNAVHDHLEASSHCEIQLLPDSQTDLR